MARNKIIFGGNVLIDLTGDTVDTSTLLSGATAHDKNGDIITGECTYDSDTSGDTVAVAEMLSGKTAHARGSKLTGTMTNNGAVNGEIATKNGEFVIPQGYHDGSGKVTISATEMAKLISSNIKEGVSILNVVGNYSGAGVSAQAKTVTPSTVEQTVLPDEDVDYLTSVTVAKIPYVETENATGITVTIG